MRRNRKQPIDLRRPVTNGLLIASIPIIIAGQSIRNGIDICLFGFSLELIGTFCLGFAWTLSGDLRIK